MSWQSLQKSGINQAGQPARGPGRTKLARRVPRPEHVPCLRQGIRWFPEQIVLFPRPASPSLDKSKQNTMAGVADREFVVAAIL